MRWLAHAWLCVLLLWWWKMLHFARSPEATVGGSTFFSQRVQCYVPISLVPWPHACAFPPG